MSSNRESFNWYFELIDEFTGPAEKIIRSIKNIDKVLEVSKKSFKNYIDEFTNLTKKVEDSAEGIQKSIEKVSFSWPRRGGKPILSQIFGNTKALGRISSFGNMLRKIGGSFFLAGDEKKALRFMRIGRAIRGFPAALGALGGKATAAFAAVAAGLRGCVAASKAYVSMFKAVAAVTFDAGKMAIGVAAFKESTQLGFKAMLGTQAAAGQIMRDAQKMAQHTNIPLENVLGTYRQILGAGFQKGEVPNLFQAFADVAAFNGNDLQIIDQFTEIFGEVRAKGVFEMEKLQEIFRASGGVVDKSTVMKNIAENLNIGVDEVAAALGRGQVTANSGLNAVLRAIQSTGGGKVGLGMLDQASSLGGLIARVVDLPRQLLFGMDFGNSQGFQALKGMLRNILSLFAEVDGAGQRVQSKLFKAFDDLFFKLFGNLSGESGKARIEEVLDKVLSNVEFFWDAFLAGMDGVKAFLTSFFNALDPTGKKDFTNMSKMLEGIGSSLGFVLGNLLDGLVSLLNFFWKFIAATNEAPWYAPGGPAIYAVYDWMKDFFFNENEGSKKTIPTKPLSTEELLRRNDYMGVGMKFSSGGIVDRPTLALMGEDGPEAIVPLTKSYGQGLSRLSGNPPLTVNVSIALDARGNDDSDNLAQRIAAALPSAIADALEGLALESQGVF